MIHVTIEAQDTQELYRELRSLLAGDISEPQALQPAKFLKIVQADPEPVPEPVVTDDTESDECKISIPDLTRAEDQPDPDEPTEPVKYPSMEECRAALNALRAKHGPSAVRTILTNHGVNSFVELDACEYDKVMREANGYEV